MPMRGELPAPATRANRRTAADDFAWSEIFGPPGSLDLRLVLFSVTGLAVSLALAHFFPISDAAAALLARAF